MEQIKSKGDFIGSIEYIKGYGVIARRGGLGMQKTFLTHGYRAAIGSEDWTGLPISKVKSAARKWVRGE